MKLLAISYYAPPQLTAQSIQVARLLYHLDAQVTLLHGRDRHCADGFRQYPDFFARVAPLAVSDPGPRLAGLAGRAAARLLPLYRNCPDRFGPLRRTGLPWLAHFSDPWAENPFHVTGPLAHRINLALERRVVAAADALLFTSERTCTVVMRKYPPRWRDGAVRCGRSRRPARRPSWWPNGPATRAPAPTLPTRPRLRACWRPASRACPLPAATVRTRWRAVSRRSR